MKTLSPQQLQMASGGYCLSSSDFEPLNPREAYDWASALIDRHVSTPWMNTPLKASAGAAVFGLVVIQFIGALSMLDEDMDILC